MNVGKYEIVQTLRGGGMALVHKARDPELDRFVAIKELAEHLRNDEQALQAFRREAKLLAQLSHPNVVGIYDVLEQNGRYYLVMEFVEGRTLFDLIKEGPVPQETAVRILQDVLTGLYAMHSIGILHRDLKPGNILLAANGAAKISDFGLAERAEDEGRPMNFGSVKYMAPELYRAADNQGKTGIDPRADIYALGIMSYEMLLGDKGFRAECQGIYPTESEIKKNEIPTRWINWHMDFQQKFRPLTQVNPQIPGGLSNIVERMTAKDLRQRYPHVALILGDMKQWKNLEGSEPELDADATIPLAGRTKPAGKVQVPPAKMQERPKSRLWLYVSGTLSIGIFILLVVIAAARKKNAPVDFRISSVPHAEVKLNDRQIGAVGANGILTGKIHPGKYRVTISLTGYDTYEGIAEIPPQNPWDLKADLHKQPPAAPPALPASMQTSTGKMLLVPAGDFIYGNGGHTANLPAFYIDETEVTNASYRKFCDETRYPYPPAPLWDPHYFEKPQFPVVNVSWNDAVAFAKWAGKRLPTELEWEKAARGTDGRTWPWGNTFDPRLGNLGGEKDGFHYAASVGSFPAGASPFKVLDMAGNVWEWVDSAYDPGSGRLVDPGSQKVLKGGSFLSSNGGDMGRTFISGKREQSDRPDAVGFRCAKDAVTPTTQVAEQK